MSRMAAFLLAGGVGKRLSLLTSFRAKPAVPFAGKYRIIDFTLSNCVRAHIDEVYVLTQYISRSLSRHLGIGKPWDLDRLNGGLHILHPRLGHEGADWYQGTADAIYQNVPTLKKLDADHVLILSGDHIYDMDYSEFLEFHIANGKPATLAVKEVPRSLCREFGIATVDRKGRITRIEEKPLRSQSNLASMGIYIFDREFLIDTLLSMRPSFEDLDFGKHIMPRLVAAGQLAAFRFDGYWLDVGTLRSYYNANIALLACRPRVDLGSGTRHVLTVPDDYPPSFISPGASVRRSIICGGCMIRGSVSGSVISPGVTVEKGAVVEDSIIFHKCVIKKGAVVRRTMIDKNSVIGAGASIGEGDRRVKNILYPDYLDFGLTLIGRKTSVRAGSRIGTNCLVCGSVKDGKIKRGEIADGESSIAADVSV
ncbi:MAG TPA: glucose-1-phosphate adenylyltransferase family protein [Candidatus Krumholzibacterium sp.]|nr:glucose-1-phosphate adenylyltransferase family protein [Candidatus Krumholzibacterium sp.]